ncbi:hypothetical protein PFTANZ_05836, partial [Plasmodium falciparum Tanzania (2000708)]
DCRGKEGDKKNCSGDGLRCDEKVPENEKIYEGFHCPSCANSCRFYKKWIEGKKIEFHKQSNAYSNQKEKAESNNGATNNKEFLEKLKQYESIHLFLDSLKNGPCKNNNDESGTVKTENSHIKFDDAKTFVHTNLCDPCSKFKIKCENGYCSGGDGDTKEKCDGKTDISAEDIETIGKSPAELIMRISDNGSNGFEGDGLQQACGSANIFKGIREDKWKCRNVCGVHICKRENEGDKKYITMKELLKRWLEYFFQDYNRIQKKLKPCTKNDKGSKCIKGCVEKWIEEKRKEWKTINDNYLKKYKSGDDGGNNLTNFLEQLQSLTELDKVMQPCESLDKFKALLKCNDTDSSKK